MLHNVQILLTSKTFIFKTFLYLICLTKYEDNLYLYAVYNHCFLALNNISYDTSLYDISILVQLSIIILNIHHIEKCFK
jgi:hypothetical protein